MQNFFMGGSFKDGLEWTVRLCGISGKEGNVGKGKPVDVEGSVGSGGGGDSGSGDGGGGVSRSESSGGEWGGKKEEESEEACNSRLMCRVSELETCG